MKRSELSEFEVEEEGFKIKIKRDAGNTPFVSSLASAPPFPVAATPPASTPTPVVSASQVAVPQDETGIAYVKSPMVGTFYRSPSPDTPSFVDSNAKVDEKSVVCIIEAMKIMNEIQAEIKGTIIEVLVENGQPVEYGQRLFKVKLG